MADHRYEIDADTTIRRGPGLEREVGDGVGVGAAAETVLLLLEDDQIGDRLQRHQFALAAGEESEHAAHHRRVGIGGVGVVARVNHDSCEEQWREFHNLAGQRG